MDDFVLSNLYESKNEWCSRLVSIFTPLIIEGVKSIFETSWKMCVETDEISKYLMTFQNLLSQVPKWNSIIVEKERQRIVERSECNYLEDLITCVHIIQLKVITAMRVGNRQKKIDLSIPKLDHFIHKIYIHVARKIYMNVYLFEKNISPLQMQKNGRELEQIIQECILLTVRESIPTESIIRAFLEEAIEHEEEITIEPIVDKDDKSKDEETSQIAGDEENIQGGSGGELSKLGSDSEVTKQQVVFPDEETIPTLGVKPLDPTTDGGAAESNVTTKLTFNDVDSVLDHLDNITSVEAPKTLERLEEISMANAMQRKLQDQMDGGGEEDDDDYGYGAPPRLQMGDEVSLENFIESDGGGGGGGSKTDDDVLPIELNIEEF